MKARGVVIEIDGKRIKQPRAFTYGSRAPWTLRLKRWALVRLAAVEASLRPRHHCFEAGCEAPGTHRIRVVLRAERGERVDVLASIVVPAVLCGAHAHAEEPLLPIDVLPRDHRRQLTKDLERKTGVPVDWDRSAVEIRHRLWAWLLWRAS